MKSKRKNSIRNCLKRGKLVWKIMWLTFIFLLLFAFLFTPFMLYDNANRSIGLVLLCVLGFVYIFIVLLYVCDWLKKRTIGDNKD